MTDSQVSKTTVLVVEDEPILRFNAVDMLEDAGFEAIEAANSAQAIQILEHRTDISAVLSDVNMPPGIDGIELVAIVRDRWPPVRIILVSGHVDRNEMRLPEGAAFFSKPYRSAEVVAMLNRMTA